MPGIASLIRLLFDNPMGYFVANIVGGFGAAFWVMFIVEYTRMYSYIMTEKQDASAQINLANQTGILLGYLLSLLFYRENNIKNLLIISIVFSVISCLLISLNRVTPNDNLIKNDLTIKKIAKEIINNKNLLRILPIGFLHFGLLSATIQAFSIQRVLLFENNKNIIGFLNLFYIFSTVLFTLLLNNLMQKKSILKIKKFDYKLTIIGLILAIIYHFVYIYVESIVFFFDIANNCRSLFGYFSNSRYKISFRIRTELFKEHRDGCISNSSSIRHVNYAAYIGQPLRYQQF